MDYRHKNLAGEKWNSLSFFAQMENIGSEVERTIKWKNKDNKEYSRMAFERALELLDFTVVDPKNRKRLKELLRTREALAYYFVFDNKYGSNDNIWQNYFYAFNWVARVNLQ